MYYVLAFILGVLVDKIITNIITDYRIRKIKQLKQSLDESEFFIEEDNDNNIVDLWEYKNKKAGK